MFTILKKGVFFLKGAHPPEHALARANAITYADCLAAINHAAKAFRTSSDRVFRNITTANVGH
jgi:hypothetical protein